MSKEEPTTPTNSIRRATYSRSIPSGSKGVHRVTMETSRRNSHYG
jgi:hypothetical protein